jgi:succinate dehydrogenase hydrophobic anchor subunit
MSNTKGTAMHASTKQFGRGRATGLVLIALVALGLGYLHFSGGTDTVSVPSGAHAGQLTL